MIYNHEGHEAREETLNKIYLRALRGDCFRLPAKSDIKGIYIGPV